MFPGFFFYFFFFYTVNCKKFHSGSKWEYLLFFFRLDCEYKLIIFGFGPVLKTFHWALLNCDVFYRENSNIISRINHENKFQH